MKAVMMINLTEPELVALKEELRSSDVFTISTSLMRRPF